MASFSKNSTLYNEYSLIYGLLCFIVVYMHSSAVFLYSGLTPGFDIYGFGTDYTILKNFVHSVTSTTVPIFFMLWGRLSAKYIDDNKPAITFLVNKTFQFYPLFFTSIILTCCKMLLSGHSIEKELSIVFFSALGLAPFFFGAHIIYPLLACLVTITIMKSIKFPQKFSHLFFAGLFLLIFFFPENTENFYVRYAIFYISFWLGVSLDFSKSLTLLKHRSLFSFILVFILCIIGTISLCSNIFSLDIFTNNSYSVGALCISFLVLLAYWHIARLVLAVKQVNFFFKFTAIIGNNAYSHFLIHYHLMSLMVTLFIFIHISSFTAQIILIITTSAITIFLINPIWKYVYNCTFLMVKKKLNMIFPILAA